MPTKTWQAVILAAGRGPDDPLAKAFGVAHKCALPIAGKSMLAWVVAALEGTDIQKPYAVSIDDSAAATTALGQKKQSIRTIQSGRSAPTSALQAFETANAYPVLLTTGDHPLLTPTMLNFMMEKSENSGADVLAGLATSTTINAKYPETKRTYFNLGGTKVSGCNLFAVMNTNGLRMLEAWQDLEKNRKKPLKLVAASGLAPLFYFITGTLTPDRAFSLMSKRLGIHVAPIFLPFAEAAIDVDKPADHALAESILKKRLSPT